MSFPLSRHTGVGDTAPAFSGLHVYLQFTWEVGLPPSPVEFSSHCHFYKLSCSWFLGMLCLSCQLACLFTAHVRGGSSPLPCGVFLPPPLSQAFTLLIAGRAPCSRPLWPGTACLFTVLGGIPLPHFSQSGRPTLFGMCLSCSYCYYSVSLFSPDGVSPSRGLCWSGPGLSVEVPRTT
jgi:hypothetical protein